MRTFSAATQALLDAGTVLRRDLVRMDVLDPSGTPVTLGYWSGAGDYVVGGVTYRSLRAGAFGDQEAVSDGSIPSLTLTLSGADAVVLDRMLQWAVNGRPMEAFFAALDPQTGQVVEIVRVFKGFLGPPKLVDDALGGWTGVTIDCQSHSRQLGRSYSDIRSDTSQRRRASGDRSMRGVVTAGRQRTNWAEDRGKPDFKKHRHGDGGGHKRGRKHRHGH